MNIDAGIRNVRYGVLGTIGVKDHGWSKKHKLGFYTLMETQFSYKDNSIICRELEIITKAFQEQLKGSLGI